MDAASKERLWGWKHAIDTPFVRGFVIGLTSCSLRFRFLSGCCSYRQTAPRTPQRTLGSLPVVADIHPVDGRAGFARSRLDDPGHLFDEHRLLPGIARATGMFRQPEISALVVVGILAIPLRQPIMVRLLSPSRRC